MGILGNFSSHYFWYLMVFYFTWCKCVYLLFCVFINRHYYTFIFGPGYGENFKYGRVLLMVFFVHSFWVIHQLNYSAALNNEKQFYDSIINVTFIYYISFLTKRAIKFEVGSLDILELFKYLYQIHVHNFFLSLFSLSRFFSRAEVSRIRMHTYFFHYSRAVIENGFGGLLYLYELIWY